MIKTKITKIGMFLISIISILLPVISLAGPSNGWVYQNPYPTSNTLLAVKFVTPKKGWIAGEKGTILYTEDGGDTWEAQESGTENDLKSIAFVNEKQGWMVGNAGTIIYTEDGGKTWLPKIYTGLSLHKVFFANDKEGWIGGDKGFLLHTKDAGKKWEEVEIGTKASIAGIFFRKPDTGWLLAGGMIYRTTDGGKNWVASQLPMQIPKTGETGKIGGGMSAAGYTEMPEEWWQGDVYFADDKHGWAVVGLWYLFHTEDGGKTWAAKDLGYMSYGLGRISFVDEKNGCAAGSSVLCTEDGGKTWNERLGIGPGDRGDIDDFRVDLWGINLVNSKEGWVVSSWDGLIAKTEDGGKTWKAKTRKAKGKPYFLNEKTGWIIVGYQGGGIMKTDDGGDTWSIQTKIKVDANIEPYHTYISDVFLLMV